MCVCVCGGGGGGGGGSRGGGSSSLVLFRDVISFMCNVGHSNWRVSGTSLVPRPSLAPVFFLHTASDQKLEPGKAWE